MSNKKQTAVEWLKKELEEYCSSSELKLDWTFDELIEQALQMEREEIKYAWVDGMIHSDDEKKADQYYNETYGGNK